MFNQDFKDMLSALSEARADFLLVGAYALAVHGFPRATGDLDIWVRADSASDRLADLEEREKGTQGHVPWNHYSLTLPTDQRPKVRLVAGNLRN